jgi:hypothetical protein
LSHQLFPMELIKHKISRLVCTTHFWNSLHHVG